LLLDFDLGLHQHEDGVLADLEILGESLLQIVFGSLDATTLTVNEGSKDMRLNKSWVLLKAIMQFSQGGVYIVSQPSSFG
jgi:hypothetical protein